MKRPGLTIGKRMTRQREARARVSRDAARSGAPATRGWSVHRHRALGGVLLVMTLLGAYTVAERSAARDEPRAIIREAADRYGVPEELIAAVIDAESRFNPRAVSRRGAQGLMQLMPKTAARLGVADPFSPRENIHGGARHLRSLMDRFDNNVPLALAAYNAGHVAVLHYGGIPPYPQTRAYVNRVLRQLKRDGVDVPDGPPPVLRAAQRGRSKPR